MGERRSRSITLNVTHINVARSRWLRWLSFGQQLAKRMRRDGLSLSILTNADLPHGLRNAACKTVFVTRYRLEILMRVLVWSVVWSVLAFAFSSLPAQAQAYDPRYPVCMKLYEGRFGGEWIDCSYTSLPQCKASASGRAAMCDINPYFAPPSEMWAPARRRHRHAHR